MEIANDKLLQIFRTMVTIREFEEGAGRLSQEARIPGVVHLYAGQEAVAAGACAHLNKDDYITSTHRGHGHLIAKGGDIRLMYAELFGGLHEDPRVHLRKFFTETCDEVVVVRDISFDSMCEHHMLPFMGKAHVAYLPGKRVIGLSKLARVVEVVARRPQVQERMTEEIANLLVEELQARGVAVVVEAVHTCMTVRGVRKPGCVCVTSAMKGSFRSKASTRAELMTLIYGDRR